MKEELPQHDQDRLDRLFNTGIPKISDPKFRPPVEHKISDGAMEFLAGGFGIGNEPAGR